MRVAILGTSGQLATELRLRPPAPSLEPCPPERAELAQRGAATALLERLRPGLVINAAAYTAVDRAEQEPELAFAVNGEGPAEVARWCQANGSALIHVSTDYVFDGLKSEPYVEGDETAPQSVYGRSKLAGEQAVRSALEKHLILRTSWVFSSVGQNFVKTMLRLAEQRDELRVVADQHGKPTAAADLARLIWALAARYAAEGGLTWGTFHVAGQGPTTWFGFADAIMEGRQARLQTRPKVTPITTPEYPTPARRPTNSVLDTTAFETTFGLTPAPWRDELHKVLQQLLDT